LFKQVKKRKAKRILVGPGKIAGYYRNLYEGFKQLGVPFYYVPATSLRVWRREQAVSTIFHKRHDQDDQGFYKTIAFDSFLIEHCWLGLFN
jgi:hypothetical protein